MSLLTSLLRDLENPDLSVNDRVERCCEATRELENTGEYEKAQKVLRDRWPRIGEAPDLTGLEESTAAELLLRAGVLTGIIGAYRPIPEAQTIAKDLITQSHAIFEARENKRKIAEAQTELAFCHFRTHNVNEARACLKKALSILTIDNELRAKALLRLANLEHIAERDHEALKILEKYAPLFSRINNDTVKGCYFTALGNRLENLAELHNRPDYLDRALLEYAGASYHLDLSGHRQYLANVENNLGFLYFKIGHYNQAHKHLNRARQIFGSLKDASSAAQVDETRACVHLAEGRIKEAERRVVSALRVQEKGGNYFLLTEALITYGRVLARSKSYAASFGTFRRAVELADNAGLANRATEAIEAAFRELGDHLVIAERGQLLSGRGVGQDKRAMEYETIKFALEQTGGKVTPAARLAGMSHQALTYAIKKRHKDLLEKRKPPRQNKQKE
jgi:tetratricopeptide (TPR) repeat protein